MSEKERGGFFKRIFGIGSKERKAQKALRAQKAVEAALKAAEAMEAAEAEREARAQAQAQAQPSTSKTVRFSTLEDPQPSTSRGVRSSSVQDPQPSTSRGVVSTQADRETLQRQLAQGAMKRSTIRTSAPIDQGAIKRSRPQDEHEELKRQLALGASKPSAIRISAPIDPNAIKRTGERSDPDAAKRRLEQDAIKRYGVKASQVDQSALKRQIEQGAIRRQLDPGSKRRQGPLVTPDPQPAEPESEPAAPKSEGFARPLSRLTKTLNPATWVSNKGVETWVKWGRDKNRDTSTTSENDSSKDARDEAASREQRPVQPSTSTRTYGRSPNLHRGPYVLPDQPGPYSGRPLSQVNRGASSSSQGSVQYSPGKQGADYKGSPRRYSPERRGAPLLDQASGYSHRGPSSGASGSSASPPINPLRKTEGLPSSPFGTIQPDLYTQRNSPLFIPLHGSGQSLGRFHLRLKYNYETSDLEIHVIEVHGLPVGDAGFSDPYFRMEAVPNVDAKKRETAAVKNNGNPYFDEHFKLPISHEDLRDETLIFQLLDADRFSRLDIIGEVRIEMYEIELVSSIEIWAEIGKAKKPREEYQELLVSLSYLPSAQRLTIVILKARNLFINPNKGTVDPFVKIYLIAEGKRTKKRRTQTKKANRNPIWNEAFTFNVSTKTLSKAAMEVCIFDQSYELIANNPLVGCCLLGNSEDGLEREHWVEVTGSPRKAVAMWHKLR